ncbi:phosphoribosylformylglycinamidine synthase subunit PurQ [Candidatus Cryosericum hinesii]|jgi:phosphoribosylformylglycinamidine synthase|uniref:Phosphoribosylformylglycinamidine synthase subunit PurQ n=1 Tax=Candidatus Cryosericum hinesii TaxID=2290915 RepID=A0A398DDF9_9BACT|nr:phosphoribosylformylglycinamidine synthase subunit PurQ [Candidatus Cryosericum hinesii]RIE09003.1 phosphoribosylformylglycinamidine synthase subunit PurQ [Candidatus Cryosericum hinesii]RIE12770.1 phosphoribosylformylglycinamidine synthase subunit PurQ [Candidatus Cryosericum hinesii]RIE12899.1 phosphoribosylformylglycinamidine synthase subunit PurQ [Candidatus Cryosericum hinesii]
MKFAVAVFPGSNCDVDAYRALHDVLGRDVAYVWHRETDLSGFDGVILPGGFSYGDYLRPGAIARFAPLMEEVVRFAGRGGIVLGVCNGFQLLTEAGLLPGALLRNRDLAFICDTVSVCVENADTAFTRCCRAGQVLRLPIAHSDGNYAVDPATLAAMEQRGQVILRYCAPDGTVDEGHNPNGSVANIAGIINEQGNVAGMMPHPERAAEELLGGTDGLFILQSMVQELERRQHETCRC